MFVKNNTLLPILITLLSLGQMTRGHSEEFNPLISPRPHISIVDGTLNLTNTLGSVNTFLKSPTPSCDVSGVITKSVGDNETSCLIKIGALKEATRVCMDEYLKSGQSGNKKNDCAENPESLINQRAYLAEKIRDLLAKFNGKKPNEAKAIYDGLSQEEKNLFSNLAIALKEKAKDKKSLDAYQMQSKAETELKEKKQSIDQLRQMGFEFPEDIQSGEFSLKISPEKFNPGEKLKNINAPEYKAIETYFGVETAKDLKNIFADPPLKNRGGTKALVIDDIVVIPNFSNPPAPPRIMGKREYNEKLDSLINNFIETLDRCHKLSAEVSTNSHFLKQTGKTGLKAIASAFKEKDKDGNIILKKDKNGNVTETIDEDTYYRDPVAKEKEDCLNDAAKMHYDMSVNFGLEKSRASDVLAALKEAIVADAKNIDKQNKKIEVMGKFQASLGSVNVQKATENIYEFYKRMSSFKNTTSLPIKPIAFPYEKVTPSKAKSCYALNYGELLVKKGNENLLDMTKPQAVYNVLIFVNNDISTVLPQISLLPGLENDANISKILAAEKNTLPPVIAIENTMLSISLLPKETKKTSQDLPLEMPKEDPAVEKVKETKTNPPSFGMTRPWKTPSAMPVAQPQVIPVETAIEYSPKKPSFPLPQKNNEASPAESAVLPATNERAPSPSVFAPSSSIRNTASNTQVNAPTMKLNHFQPTLNSNNKVSNSVTNNVTNNVTNHVTNNTNVLPPVPAPIVAPPAVMNAPVSNTVTLSPNNSNSVIVNPAPINITQPAINVVVNLTAPQGTTVASQPAIAPTPAAPAAPIAIAPAPAPTAPEPVAPVEKANPVNNAAKEACEKKIAENPKDSNFSWNEEFQRCDDLVLLEKEQQECLKKQEKDSTLFWNDKNNKCENKNTAMLKEECDEKTKKDPNMVWNTTSKKCENKKLLLDKADCEKKIAAQKGTGKDNISWSEPKGLCEDRDALKIEKDKCNQMKVKNPEMAWNEQINKCENKKIADSKRSCLESKQAHPEEFDWDETLNVCNNNFKEKECLKKVAAGELKEWDRATGDCKDTSDKAEKECIEKDRNEEDGRRANNFSWNKTTKKCEPVKKIDPPKKKENPDGSPSDTEFTEAPAGMEYPYPQMKMAPRRFIETRIPRRSMYMMPGMP